MRTVHTRHEQGAAYMALGAALATGKPQAYAVVPGPGLLNSGAALLTAYSMNAPVLALIGQIPEADDRTRPRPLHEIRDQAGIIKRLVDHSRADPRARARRRGWSRERSARCAPAGRARPRSNARSMSGASAGAVDAVSRPLPVARADDRRGRDRAEAAKLLGAAKNPMIVCGGGAQDASRRGDRAVRHAAGAGAGAIAAAAACSTAADPFSVTLPLGRELWGEADVVLAVGTRMLDPVHAMGHGRRTHDHPRRRRCRRSPRRLRKPAVALIGDAAPILRRLIDALPAHNAQARLAQATRWQERQAKLAQAPARSSRRSSPILDAIRAELPEDGIFVDEVTQIGFAARLAFPVYKPRTFLSPGYQDNLGWGFATALGAQDARRDVPVLSITGDGGFMFTANEMATAVRHRIPLTAIVFTDGAFGNVRRIQEEKFGNRLIASDLANPDFVKFAESFGAAGERAAHAGGAARGAAARRSPRATARP